MLFRSVPRLHRVLGRIVLGAIAAGGSAGLVMAPSSTGGPIGAVGIVITGLLWLSCAAAALRAIRRRDVPAHRRWAVRTLALTYTAVTLRLGVLVVGGLPVTVAGADPDAFHEGVYTAFLLVSSPINLAVAEWYLATRRRRTTRRHPRASEPAAAAVRTAELGTTA